MALTGLVVEVATAGVQGITEFYRTQHADTRFRRVR